MVKWNKTPSLNTVREYCIINHLILAFSLFHYLENHIVKKAKCTWTTLPKSLHIGVSSLTVSPPLFTSRIWQKYKPRFIYLFIYLCTLYQDPLLAIVVVSGTSSKPHRNYARTAPEKNTTSICAVTTCL